MQSASLTEYIISYSKTGFQTPLTPEGLADYRKEVASMTAIAAEGTDYRERTQTVSPLTVLSFVTRPDEQTVSFHRVWSDKDAGDIYYGQNDTSIFENFRQNGWSVSWTSQVFDSSQYNGSNITII